MALSVASRAIRVPSRYQRITITACRQQPGARRPRRVPSSRRRSHNSRARKNTVSSRTSSTAEYVTMEST
jgi:hypothetical protein